jgi:hypothetical protein
VKKALLISAIFLLSGRMTSLPAAEAAVQPWNKHGRLTVSKSNPHYLQYEDGTFFFWLGDTGWEMLHRLNREEIEYYLDNRRKALMLFRLSLSVSSYIRIRQLIIIMTAYLLMITPKGLP